MNDNSAKQLLSKLVDNKSSTRSLEDLQYNLSSILNEDVYLKQIKQYGDESLMIISYLLKLNIIYIATKNKRILLTPTGENLLFELNNMLFHAA